MKHKDYMKLMKTPFEKLSEEDQKKRKKEFLRHLKFPKLVCSSLQHTQMDFYRNPVQKLFLQCDFGYCYPFQNCHYSNKKLEAK